MSWLLEKLNITLPPLPTAPPSHEPASSALVQLAVLIAVALILHFSIANPVIAFFSVGVFLLKCFSLWRQAKAPSQWLILLLTISSIVIVIIFYGGWNGKTAGISFLVILVALKFLESQTVRDYFVVCVILYFLTASSFLFNSSLPSILMVVAYAIGITGILFQITNPTPTRFRSTLIASTTLIAKAIPLALFLFFFFPRIQGNFGFIPSLDRNTAGLDDALVAGEMAASAFNNEIAFQASFKGSPPPTSQLYWRAKVMGEEIDFTWRANIWKPKRKDNSTENLASNQNESSKIWSYEILHRPTLDVLLPHLDYVTDSDAGTIGSEHTVKVRSRKQDTFSYSGKSILKSPSAIPTLSNDLLTTKSRPTARLQALIGEIQRQHQTPLERANAVFQYFKNSGFTYSLTPPGLEETTPLDDFIFNTKEGYCEHYASAFTTLLRWLGVPARVVVGYHGGTLNAAGNFIEVRYSDAHAWSEVFIQGKWVRFDATAATSPERIEYGMQAIQNLWGEGYRGSNIPPQALSNILNPKDSYKAWRKAVETWSNVQYQWKKWIVDYDSNAQQELLTKLGLSAKNSLTTLIAILSSGVAILLALYFWQLLPKPKRLNSTQKLYKNYLTKVSKSGIDIVESLTPNEVAQKLYTLNPKTAKTISNITNMFNKLNYGRDDQDFNSLNTKLKKEISQLKLIKVKT